MKAFKSALEQRQSNENSHISNRIQVKSLKEFIPHLLD